MRIAILVEGKTESAFKPYLLLYLQRLLAGKMPKLDFMPYHGRIPTDGKLHRVVENLLNDTKRPADAVIALTDVYTGKTPPDFPTAEDAKRKMREWVGTEKRFHPHVALHDFEAWLLPYWDKIKKLAGSNRKSPGKSPEAVDHGKSPAYWLAEVFRTGSKNRDYVKARDAGQILKDEDLAVAIAACPELRAFVDTIVVLSCGYELRLKSPVNDASGIPKTGKSLVVVALVGPVLHFRIFDDGGKMAVYSDEKSVKQQGGTLRDLKKRLAGLWPPHELTKCEEVSVIAAVTSLLGHKLT